MPVSTKLDRLHLLARENRWMWYFSIIARIILAAGFLPSGFVKIMGERFTDLSNNQPMGHYLEALYHTGYYYTVIGVIQFSAGLMLLFPRTVVLGAVIYFPIILNICVLSFSVRFDGSLLTSPLMVLANLYLLCWHYDRLKFIFPFNETVIQKSIPKIARTNNRFPTFFFLASFATFVIVVVTIVNLYNIKPRNTLSDCEQQCKMSKNKQGCLIFCQDIHVKGKPLHQCLDEYQKAGE